MVTKLVDRSSDCLSLRSTKYESRDVVRSDGEHGVAANGLLGSQVPDFFCVILDVGGVVQSILAKAYCLETVGGDIKRFMPGWVDKKLPDISLDVRDCN